MFLPIKADFPLPRFPVLTVAVCVVCLFVFLKQQSDWKDYDIAISQFCAAERSHIENIVYERIAETHGTDECFEIFYGIANDPERSENESIEHFATTIEPLTGFNSIDSSHYVTDMLEDELRRFKRLVPEYPDEGLAYYTGSWNPVTMLTSSFAHGDWFHIAFNLVFFFAFAATVEILIGPLWYIAFILVDSLFIGVTGSMAAAAAGDHYWTLGLSGVVTGMMGLFAYLLPSGKIKCFYFFIIVFGTVAVPAWILAAWFIGSDVFALLAYDDHGVTNVMAHVMGGVGGYLFGVLLLGDIRRRTRQDL